jgi:hypothetical protein
VTSGPIAGQVTASVIAGETSRFAADLSVDRNTLALELVAD